MKQEQFKNVYQHIRLTAQQKDKIWKQLGTTSGPGQVRKKAPFPTRAAACFGVLLMSGMTVFAAGELSLWDKLDEAMKTLTQSESVLTQDQKNLYTQYGKALDNEIELENGILRLDAALYDENHLMLPFRYVFHADAGGHETLTAGTGFGQKSLPKLQNTYHGDMDAFLHEFRFYTAHDSAQPGRTPNGTLLIAGPEITEDGTVSGSILLYDYEPQTFRQGDVIQLVRAADEDIPGQTATKTDTAENFEPYTSFTLGKALEQQALTVSADHLTALENMGISIESMSLSPLSLCYAGKGTHTQAFSASITAVLKNGRVIESSPNGSGHTLRDASRDNTSFSFFARVLFAEPVLPEDVAEIHIQDHHGTDIHIPVGDNQAGIP